MTEVHDPIDAVAARRIPIAWERGRNHVPGRRVLFLDGHHEAVEEGGG